jgi:hypothetical protein
LIGHRQTGPARFQHAPLARSLQICECRYILSGITNDLGNSSTREPPTHVQGAALSQIFSYSVGLNSDEQRRHRIITQELQGNAKPGKHEADADHLFEAAKYGGYFITHDDRIRRRAGQLGEVLPPSLTVVTLADFLAIFDDYAARYPR